MFSINWMIVTTDQRQMESPFDADALRHSFGRIRTIAYLVLIATLLVAYVVKVNTDMWVAAVVLALGVAVSPLLSTAGLLMSDLVLALGMWWLFGPVSGADFVPFAVVSIAAFLCSPRQARVLLAAAVATFGVELGLHFAATSDWPMYLFHAPEPIPNSKLVAGSSIAAAILLLLGLLLARIATFLRAGSEAMAADLERQMELVRLKDQFVATVSHQLRTPLTSVRGFADILMEQDPGEVERMEFLQLISNEAEGLAGMVEDVITFQKAEAGRLVVDREPVDLAATIGDVTQALGLASGSFVVLVPKGVVAIADPVRLRQTLRILVDNALRYGAPPVAITAHLGDGVVVLTVGDQGDGISEDAARVAFEPHARLVDNPTMSEPGLGLGLPLARHLAEAQGGSLRHAGGSVFELVLPAA